MKPSKSKARKTPDAAGKNYSKIFTAAAAGIGLAAAAYFVIPLLFAVHTKPPQALPAGEAKALKPEDALAITVQRAYAVDARFQEVYNNGWEAANGAIGEAFLYAATGDQNLLDRYEHVRKLTDLFNGTWVDDRAWICLAELYWWQFSGKKNKEWVDDAEKRYMEARNEGRLSNKEGFWSWYTWPPNAKINDMILTNSNTNQMVTVACMLYEATRNRRFYTDAIGVWEGDGKYPGIEKTFYRGDGKWEGKGGMAAFGKQLPWESASYLSVVAAMYRMTGNPKYKAIAAASAKYIMDPAHGWVDSTDFYQLRMDGNGAFVHFVLDAYLIAPELLPDIPFKVEKMLEHVWSNHHGASYVLLHRLGDDGIRNGWNPRGGEEGYGVDQIGTVHPQSQAVRAFGVFAYVLRGMLDRQLEKK
ncbi:MAG TPA: hypothetical protein VMF88_08375 [Bacteroidota bacterium]|nr:hypothetical protein [Bacteroidota bacterium]